jgi:hypothetical protein
MGHYQVTEIGYVLCDLKTDVVEDAYYGVYKIAEGIDKLR